LHDGILPFWRRADPKWITSFATGVAKKEEIMLVGESHIDFRVLFITYALLRGFSHSPPNPAE
jgi:hypothetical protein